MNDIEKVEYTRVCKSCEIPEKFVRVGFAVIMIRFVVAISATALFLLSFFVVGIFALVLALVYEVFIQLQKGKCKTCGDRSLVPVSTPAGVRIMGKNGWVALSK